MILLNLFVILLLIQSDLSANVNESNQDIVFVSALLLTTFDSISLVYPKEMGYDKDFVQIIFRFTAHNTVRIEDAVYDNTSCAVYFAVTSTHNHRNELKDRRTTQLFKLTRNCKRFPNEEVKLDNICSSKNG